ncbi:hypothetical protein BDL97_17G056100 [Sphagnum fallax]|nr:hypothetical protein BDL97_17G056100 [Sphagnum fallax]
MIRELPEAQVQPAHPQLHSLKSSSPRSSSYKQDSSQELNSRSRITSVLEAQGRRTRFKHEETIKNPAEAFTEHFGNLPSSDITHSSVTESADRLFVWESIPKLAEAQTFSVYELNEFDRDSPAFLEFSRQTVNKVDPDTGAHIHALGDQVAFTNKLHDGSLKLRLGITAGICLLMKHYPGMGTPEMKRQQVFFTPERRDTGIYRMGTWILNNGSVCELPGYIDEHHRRSGFLQRGKRSSSPPTQHLSLQILYTFTLTGIPELPKHLTASVVQPSESPRLQFRKTLLAIPSSHYPISRTKLVID